MAHTYTNLLTHIIFSTKNREPTINDEIRARLFPYMGGVLREIQARPILINGTSDHVHLLIAMPPTISVSDSMRILKTNSSRWVHETWPTATDFGWQAGYGAFSVSQSNAEAVRGYIADQENHHRRMTFKEEFLAFLRRHEIDFDERYIWE